MPCSGENLARGNDARGPRRSELSRADRCNGVHWKKLWHTWTAVCETVNSIVSWADKEPSALMRRAFGFMPEHTAITRPQLMIADGHHSIPEDEPTHDLAYPARGFTQEYAGQT